MLLSLSFLLALTVSIGVGCLIAFEKMKRKGKEADRINKIMKVLSDEESSVKKTRLMDELNIKPRTLSQILEIMTKNNLVLVTETSVKITKFGKSHFDNFVISKV